AIIGYPYPHFGLTVTNRLRFYMIDTQVIPNRIIDYVSFEFKSHQDLTAAVTPIANGTNDFGAGGFSNPASGVWNTNRVGGTNGMLQGVINQIYISTGSIYTDA